MSEESDSFAKPTGDHVILPNEKNFYFHAKQEPPRADIVVPGGQFAIEGIDKPNELPKRNEPRYGWAIRYTTYRPYSQEYPFAPGQKGFLTNQDSGRDGITFDSEYARNFNTEADAKAMAATMPKSAAAKVVLMPAIPVTVYAKGEGGIEGIDKPNELPKTKARIAKQPPKGKNPIKYGGPSLESAVIIGGILLVVGFAASRKA